MAKSEPFAFNNSKTASAVDASAAFFPVNVPKPSTNVPESSIGATGGAPYLIHVGHRKNYKNFRTILKAFCRMAPKTDRHLLIIGGKDRLDED